MDQRSRIFLSALVFLAVAASLVAFWSCVTGGLIYQLTANIGTVVPGKTVNTNTSVFYNLLESFAVFPIAAGAGAIAAAWVYEPSLSPLLEKISISAVFLVVGGVAAVNIAAHDQLIRVSAQAILDFILAGSSLAVVILLWRWSSGRAVILALRAIAMFLISMFGILLPTYYGTSYYAQKLGLPASSVGSFSQWRDVVAGTVSLVAAMAAVTNRKI